MNRRTFLSRTALAGGGLLLPSWSQGGLASSLPSGKSPPALAVPHFPDALHAFVWRNWQLVPLRTMARVVGTTPRNLARLGHAMGLPGPPSISADAWRRSSITVIRTNWHLLPYEQLLDLLGWTEEELRYALREDDFLFVKLGNLKPACPPLRYAEPGASARARQGDIARIVRQFFPQGAGAGPESLFDFVRTLSRPGPKPVRKPAPVTSRFRPRYCYSYFALYGDPLADPSVDPYPDGYLARLAETGVDGVWLQGVLSRLAPFPWDATLSRGSERRLENLRKLIARARAHGIGIYLYLNEPRSLPIGFFQKRPELRGVTEGEHAALCTSVPEVQDYLTRSVATLCREAPDLAGLFTITGSENFTHCWSHGGGQSCPRCANHGASTVIAQLLAALQQGIESAGNHQRLIAWDWGWADEWVPGIVDRLPTSVSLMSVSEWSLPIERGGVRSTVGEYSISAVGPGPRARRHWALARARGLRALAKIQAGNTWELSAVPYIPALANVARHAAQLRTEGIDGLMLGWTLGGYPSPNLEVVAALGADPGLSAEDALDRVARRRFGPHCAPAVVRAWKAFSAAFSEFPFGSGLYSGPLQMGPANPLWLEPTHYAATMVGFPYDDLEAWSGNYPPEVFAAQLGLVASGASAARRTLEAEAAGCRMTSRERAELVAELRVMEACAIHFRSAAEQCHFILARRRMALEPPGPARDAARERLVASLRSEMESARQLHALQVRDSRLGFEASNHYFYVPLDLVEKVVACRHSLERLGVPGDSP